MNVANMDQGYKIHLGPVEIPTELQENMLAAHNALVEKRAHIGRIKAGQRDMRREIAEAQTELETAKKAISPGSRGLPRAKPNCPLRQRKPKPK